MQMGCILKWNLTINNNMTYNMIQDMDMRYDMNRSFGTKEKCNSVPCQGGNSSLLGTEQFHAGTIEVHQRYIGGTREVLWRNHGVCSWYHLLRFAAVLLLMVVGVGSVWGQNNHPYAGVWYMTNNYKKNTYYYVVPAKDPQITTKEDAFFSSDYNSQAGNSEMPFITTFTTGGDLNSIWIFVPVTNENNYYYIVHALTGKYVKYQQYLTGNNARRKYIHLETIPNPGETEKFEITTYDNNGVKIKPKNNAMYFNIAGENQDRYNGGSAPPYYSGIIGGMSGTDGGSKFVLVDASSYVCATPTITYNESTHEVNISTTTVGATIY